MGAALEASGVCRKYCTQEVLRDFSLTVEAGSFEVLMGPSGSGKSTFLHLAAGLIAADRGSIRIGETDVTALGDAAATKFRRRNVGVVFQAFNLLEERSVRENVLLPITLERRRDAKDARTLKRFADLIERLGLAGKEAKRARELSGGEQQRVAVARALIAEPAIVLADEPTGNLDAVNTKAMCELLKAVNAAEKSALLVATHDPVVAACAAKVHFLKDGRIAASFETGGDAEFVSRKYLEFYR